MKRTSSFSRFRPPFETSNIAETWHNGADVEILLFSRSLQAAAKVLIGKLKSEPDLWTGFDSAPIILLYREAVELHLKLLVGEGGNFLNSKPDPISLYRTHSLRWLAQITVQIIKKVNWERDFTCLGISDLADFSAKVQELEALDPVYSAVNPSAANVPRESKSRKQFDVIRFEQETDALIELLTATADSLAEMWDQRTGMTERSEHVGPGFLH